MLQIGKERGKRRIGASDMNRQYKISSRIIKSQPKLGMDDEMFEGMSGSDR
jgi:hypothetical protein